MSQPSSVSVIALRCLPMFSGLQPAALEPIARVSLLRRVQRGATVVMAGDSTDFVYIVLSGSLKVLVNDEEGREVILSLLGPGELFGEMGVIDDTPRSATVVAAGPADLVVFAKTDFRRVMQENFDVALYIMKNLAHRLRVADRKIESLALLDVYGRVARLLLENAQKVGDEMVVVKKITKQDMAKMIGASREMVSRVMKDLQTQGLIEETGGKVILYDRISQVG